MKQNLAAPANGPRGRRSIAETAAVIVLGALCASCGPKTGALKDGSQMPSGPRVARGETFAPRVGDFATIESFRVAPNSMKDAASTTVEVVLPRIRERGGLRQAWVLRNDSRGTIEIVSIWSDAAQFQVWQMSSDRLAAYQALGPVLIEQPSAAPVSVIGLVGVPTP